MAHTVDETAGTGTSLGSYTSMLACVDDLMMAIPITGNTGTSGSVTLVAGENVISTFTNTLDNGNLTLAKSVSPAGETFNLQVTGFGAEELGDGQSGTQRSVAANTEITFNEANGTGTLTDYTSSIECRDDGDNSLVSLDTDNGTDGGVTLNPNQSVTCTFTNTLITASITLIKDVSPNNGDDFGLDIDGPAADDASDPNVADGGSISVPSGVPGVYNLSESDGTGAARISPITKVTPAVRSPWPPTTPSPVPLPIPSFPPA